MEYDLKKPCAKCPFRTDCPKGWLGKRRAQQIASSIVEQQGTFACHETTEHDDDTGEHVRTEGEQHCAGALIMLERIGRPNQMMRLCERLGMYDRTKLDMDAPVFDTPTQFVKHHTEKKS